jgi:hypothetical protein
MDLREERDVASSGVVAVAGTVVVTPGAPDEDMDSTLWAGYASAVDEGSFDSVSAKWEVPRVECRDGEVHTMVAVWVGLDGLHNDAVEQTGTASACEGDVHGVPMYYAWVQMKPQPSQILPIEVRPGDSMAASVELQDGQFRFKIRNVTLEQEYSDSWPCQAPGLSAEAVIEAPRNYQLPEFAPIRLHDVMVDGSPIGELEPDRIILARGDPRVVRAEPGELTDEGTAFQVFYRDH